MTFRLVFSLLTAILTGLLLVGIFWPGTRPVSPLSSLRWTLSAGIGIGISSCFFFLWLLFSRPWEYWLLEMMVIVCLAALYFRGQRDRISFRGKGPRADPLASLPLHRILAFSLYGTLGCACVAFILFYFAGPHGGWDAWSIWNLRARFLFRGLEDWRVAFSALLAWSHPDYPLLLPGAVARSWKYAGLETPLGPALISSLFTFATIGITASSISGLRGRSQGYLAGLLLVATHYLLRDGVSQYADVPLGFYFLATIILLSYQRRMPGNRNIAMLAGTTAGLSAWTKNEGLLFLVAVVAAQLAPAAASRKWKEPTRIMLSFFAGLLPVLIIIFYFKLALAPPNDLISSLAWKPTMMKILDFTRHMLVAGAFLHEMAGFPVLFLAVSLICLGITPDKQQRSEGTRVLGVLCVMLLGYFFIYVTTYQHLAWHLQTSLRRILVPLWPIAVFTFFLFVRTPEEAARTASPIFLRLLKNFLTKVFRL